MKFADVHRFWLRKRPDTPDEKPTLSPLRIGEDGRLFVQHDYVVAGKVPPLGIVVGEFWWDEYNVLQTDIWPVFDEIRAKYGL